MEKTSFGALSYMAVFSIVSYAIIAVASDIFANKMLNLGGLTLAGGILFIPFSFTMSPDRLLSEVTVSSPLLKIYKGN